MRFQWGTKIPEKGEGNGSTTLIHYSFPAPLIYGNYSDPSADNDRRMVGKLGIKFVDVTAPDPTGDAGLGGAQQFILEDVPRQIAEYGKDTCFFSTNCGMQEPLIRSVWENGAILVQQCCPSPYHGYPAALDIDVTGHEGDINIS